MKRKTTLFLFLITCFPFFISGQIDSLLYQGIIQNDLGIVEQAIQQGADLNAKDENGATPLMWAVYKSDLKLVKLLVANGATLMDKGIIRLSTGGYYGSLTTIAAGEGKLEHLKYLIEELNIPVDDKEYNPATKKKDGWTALQFAANRLQIEIVEYLIQHGANQEIAYNQLLQMREALEIILENIKASIELNLKKSKSLVEQEKFEESISLLNETVKDIRYHFGGDHGYLAFALNNLAFAYVELNQYKKAFIAAKEAFNLINENDLFYESLLEQLVLIHLKLESYKKGQPLLEELTNIQNNTDNNTNDYIRRTSLLADVYMEMGDFQTAIKFYEEIYKWVEKNKIYFDSIRLNNGIGYDAFLDNFATCYLMTNQPEKAIDLYILSLKLTSITKGEENLDYAIILGNLAELYKSIGNNERVLNLLQKSLTIKKKILPIDHPSLVSAISNLASHYFDNRNYEKALLLRKEAIEFFVKTKGMNNDLYANELVGLSDTYRLLGDHDNALIKIHEAFNIFKSILGNKYPKIVDDIKKRAKIEHQEGNEAIAFLLNEEALLHIKEAHTGLSLGDISRSALYLFELGFYEQAAPRYEKALELAKKHHNQQHPNYITILNNLALLYDAMKNQNKAANYFRMYNDEQIQRIRNKFTYFSESEQEVFGWKIAPFFNHGLSFIYRNSTHRELLEQYYNFQLLFKGHRLQNQLWLKKTIQSSSDKEILKKTLAWNKIREKISSQYALSNEKQYHNLDSLILAANDIESELTRLSTPFKNAQKTVKWHDIQNQLTANEAAIEFLNFYYTDEGGLYLTDSIYYVAFLVRKDYPHPQMIPLFEQKQLQKLLSTKTSFNNDFYRGEDGVVPVNKAAAIKQLVWSPLDSFLTDIKTIYYSPSGLLNRINLAAIPLDSTQNSSHKYDLHYVGSTRQLVFDKHTYSEQKDAIILGGIQYDSLAINSTSTVTEGYTINRSYNNIGWQYLQGTEKEAQTISDSLLQNNFQVTLKSKDKATEAFVKTIGKDQPSPKVLHIATHGFFFAKPKPEDYENMDIAGRGFRLSQNPLIRSGLILSGANKVWLNQEIAEEEEDNILTAYEIAQMNLRNTELVVLSACETGLGDIVDNEGVYGLQRAFKMAGAKNVIMSLWKVPDAETQELMTTFYSNWMQGQSIHDAFYGAQKTMREKYIDEPYKWAGFVLME